MPAWNNQSSWSNNGSSWNSSNTSKWSQPAAARPSSASGRPGTVAPTAVASSPAAQQQGQKRAWSPSGSSPAAASAAASGAAGKGQTALKVTTLTKKNDVATNTLLGDYAEKGTSHGRKYYQKTTRIPGHPNVDVFLYYWDNRDGQEFSGWWFGDQLGGTQVWARAAVHTPTPPKSGWRLPWDAPTIQPGALVVELATSPAASSTVAATPASGSAAARTQSPAAGKAAGKGQQAQQPAGMSPALRLKKITDEVTAAEKLAANAAEQAKRTTALPSPTEAALKANQDALQKQQAKLSELVSTIAKEITEVRKAGPAGATQATEMAKLPARVKASTSTVVAELNKVKNALTKAFQEKQKAEAEKKKKEQEEAQKKQEEKEAKEFQLILAKVTTAVKGVETAVEKVSAAATPILASESAEGMDEKLAAVEKEATEAQKKLADTRTDINTKLAAAKKYAPEAKKTAMKELLQLQQRVADAQKKLNPNKSIKTDFPKRLEARKALAEISEKFAAAETAIGKASELAKAADAGAQMSDEEVAAVDEAAQPAQKGLGDASNMLNKKGRGADAATQAEIEALRARHAELRKRLDAVNDKMKGQRDAVAVQKYLAQAKEKTDKVDAALEKCQEAEMPFLKGIEVLPKDESDKALGDSDSAASAASAAVQQARGFLKSKLAESKRFAKELATTLSEQFAPLSARVEAAEAKVNSFKKDTSERKLAAVLAEVVEAIGAAERKVGETKEAAKALSGSLDETPVDELKEAVEKATAADKEASGAINEAKRVLGAKQKHAGRGGDAAAGISKLQTRLNAAVTEQTKQKQALQSAQKTIKAKQVLVEEGDNLKKAQDALTRAEEAVALGDEMQETHVRTYEEASKEALAALKPIQHAVQPLLNSAPPEAKAALQKLLDGKKEVQEKLDKLKASTKKRREEVLSGIFVKDGEEKVAAVEASLEKASDAELPFLKGIEVLPMAEAKATIEASEKASAEGLETVQQARSFIAAKQLELKHFDREVAKPVTEAFAELTKRVNAGSARLSQFGKDTAVRKKAQQVQEAGAKVEEVEAEAKKVLAAAEPFMKEDAKDLTEEAAAAPLQNYLAIEKEAKAKMSETRSFVSERQRASKDNAEQTDTLKKLQVRLQEAQTEMTKARKATSDHEQRFVAKRLVEEVNEKLATLDGEVKKAADFCAPLVEHGGEEFLVWTSIRTLADALGDHMKAKSLDAAGLFKEAGGPTKASQAAFVKWLEALPAASGHEEVAFSEERRAAIFKKLDKDGDGALSAEEFQGIFHQKCVCKKDVSLTDGFAIADSKTVAKVEAGDELEIVGASREDDAGMTRCEVKLAEGQTGWITRKGNQGTLYVEAQSPVNAFEREAHKAITESLKNVAQVGSFLAGKLKEGGSVSAGPLATARNEVSKLRSQVNKAQNALEDLRKKLKNAKFAFKDKERAEKNAHVVARTQREAEVITGPAATKVDEAVAAGKAAEEKGEALVSQKTEELEAFAEPMTVLAAVEAAAAAAASKVDAARAAIKEQQQAAADVKPPTAASTEAKKQLQQMQGKVETASKAARKTLEVAKRNCKLIVDQVSDPVAQALRTEAYEKHRSVDGLFDAMAKGKEAITQADFEKKICGLAGLSVKEQHAKLLAKRVGGAGEEVSRRRFLGYVQLYNAVVKDIALTDVFDVGTTKTIRKVEKEEVLEVLEGPRTDEKLGLSRVRARSLLDNQEGWVSVQGNQGTSFLQKVQKPMFTTRAEVPLDKEFSSRNAAEPVRTLAEDEILELLEGPRKDVLPDALRARVKVTKDGAMGWITVRERNEAVNAAANERLYSITGTVAMTDGEDIKECKVLRKLAVGEFFEASSEPKTDAETGVVRVAGKALKDGMEGFITTKGNAGTVYAEAAAKYYSIKREVDLQKQFSTSGQNKVIRKLEVGETLQVLEGPKEEKAAPEVRLKVRAASDKAVGWITRKDDKVKNWKHAYRCFEKVPLHDAPNAEGAKELREIQKHEIFEHLEGPVKAADGKGTRIRGCAIKDGLVGWVTLRNEEGKRFFDC